MGLVDNLRELSEALSERKTENAVERTVKKQSVESANYYREYTEFANALQEQLISTIGEGNPAGAVEYSYKEGHREYAKFFEQTMTDSRFTSSYDIRKTAGGTYRYTSRNTDAIIQGILNRDDRAL